MSLPICSVPFQVDPPCGLPAGDVSGVGSAVPPAAPAGSVPDPVVDGYDRVHRLIEGRDGIDPGDVAPIVHVVSAVGSGVVLLAVGFLLVWTVAGRRGWAPARLRNFAAAALVLPVMTMVWSGWLRPLVLFTDGAGVAGRGQLLAGAARMLVAGVPVVWFAVTIVWARYLRTVNTIGLQSIDKTERILHRHTERRMREAARAARLSTALCTRAGSALVLGRQSHETAARPSSVWRELITPHRSLLSVGYGDARKHVGSVGAPGCGKTVMLMRWCAAAYRASWVRYVAALDAINGVSGVVDRFAAVVKREFGVVPRRPLLVFVNAKGGSEGVRTGREFRRVMRRLGVEESRIGVWGVDPACRLDIWGLPARDLESVLTAMVPAGNSDALTASEAHFENMRKAIVHLVVAAPEPYGKPIDSEDFLSRLNAEMLAHMWGLSWDPDGDNGKGGKGTWTGDVKIAAILNAVTGGKEPALPSDAVKFDNLFRLMAGGFDGGRALDDFDALYVSVAGTTRVEEATAQCSAVVELVLQFAATDHHRDIWFVFDEFSAVPTVPIVGLLERARSQGVAAMVSAQSFEGLGPTEDARTRLFKACAGGWVIGQTEGPDDLVTHFGTIRGIEPSRHTLGGRHGTEGQVKAQDQFLVNPNLIRRLQAGEVCYVHAGRARWGRVVPVDIDRLIRLRPPRTHAATAPAAAWARSAGRTVGTPLARVLTRIVHARTVFASKRSTVVKGATS